MTETLPHREVVIDKETPKGHVLVQWDRNKKSLYFYVNGNAITSIKRRRGEPDDCCLRRLARKVEQKMEVASD